jgi:hypothetical protein
MVDGSQRILSWNQSLKGFSDTIAHRDSPEARVIASAVTDDNGGAMLSLLKAVTHPVNTDT